MDRVTPLKIALVHRDSPRNMDGRMVGFWSYPVPEFEWEHIIVGRGFTVSKDKLADQGYDAIVWEDAKTWGRFTGTADIPLCYIVVDSTLSEGHYKMRHDQARQADLVLVDWDKLGRFRGTGRFVARLSHCVNDRYFRDYGEGKPVDVGNYQGRSEERSELHERLLAYAEGRDVVYEYGRRPQERYALDMSRSKIVINWNRNNNTRGHRIFDTMACRSCLLTNPVPAVMHEERKAGWDYVEFRSWYDMEAKLDMLLDGAWVRYADAGYKLVQQRHTWAVRARELRAIMEATVL